jgi:diguanylate cyclase (GGDEF)-like protein
LLFLDLDGFKRINDSLGHAVGDALLKAVAARLQLCIRRTDTIARQGGDEFLLVLAEIRDPEDITSVALSTLEHMAAPFLVGGHELSVTASVGAAVYPDDGRDWDTLFKKADVAMYCAKEAGRNAYRFYAEQMNADADEYLSMRNKLQHALERGEFVMHYQPQVNLMTGGVTGVEALIRWNSPELGLVPPARFIPLAEDSGLIVPIGAWVLKEACRQAEAWRKAGMTELTMAINLSAVQFKRGDVLGCVQRALTESGFNPACLELEMTESILIKDTANVLATVRQLKAMGIKLSIDDFGTGYSSLSYLKRFNADKVKIDQSFVRDIATDANSDAIVCAIVHMAKSLGLSTIAEGVEDEQVLAALRRHGCDEVQGYYYSRPMAPELLSSYLSMHRPVEFLH